MKECISREAALALLRRYNKESFHILHALTVEVSCAGMPPMPATAKMPIFGPP